MEAQKIINTLEKTENENFLKEIQSFLEELREAFLRFLEQDHIIKKTTLNKSLSNYESALIVNIILDDNIVNRNDYIKIEAIESQLQDFFKKIVSHIDIVADNSNNIKEMELGKRIGNTNITVMINHDHTITHTIS